MTAFSVGVVPFPRQLIDVPALHLSALHVNARYCQQAHLSSIRWQALAPRRQLLQLLFQRLLARSILGKCNMTVAGSIRATSCRECTRHCFPQ